MRKFPNTNCEQCPLHDKGVVLDDSHGSTPVDVLFVAEAPADTEVYIGKCMQGPAGNLANSLVKDMEIKDYRFTNLVACGGYRDLEPDDMGKALDCCAPRIDDTIEEVQPLVVASMGMESTSYFLPGERKGIMTLNGSIIEPEEYGYDYAVVPVYNPGFVLRNPKMLTYYVDGMKAIPFYLRGETDYPLSWSVCDSQDSLEAFLNKCEGDLIGVDIETSSFSPFQHEVVIGTDGEEHLGGKILGVSITAPLSGTNNTDVSMYIPEEFIISCKSTLQTFFDAKQVLCHNGQFDLSFIKAYGYDINLHEDTLLASYTMDETPYGVHGLKTLAKRLLNVRDWSEEIVRPKNTSYAGTPEEILAPYCCKDSQYTYKLHSVLAGQMDDNEYRLYKEHLIPLSNMFLDIRHRGIRIDVKRLVHLYKKWSKDIIKMELQLRKFGIDNANSWQQIRRAYIKYGVVQDAEEYAGSNKIESEILMRYCQEEENWDAVDLLNLLAEYKSKFKAYNTFLREVASNLSEVDARVHPDTRLFSTVTGRIVVSAPTLTNYPGRTALSYDLRSIFIPDKGNTWLHFDQSAFEFRIFSAINKDMQIAEMFNSGRDPHQETGLAIFGPDYEEINKQGYGLPRVQAKTVNFGRMYGRGPGAMASTFGVDMEEAKRWCRAVDSKMPGIGKYRREVEDALATEQELVNPFGRKRRFPIITEENHHKCLNEAYNFPIQSTASDINLLSMRKVFDDSWGTVFPLFPIHDSIEFEVPESEIDYWKGRLTEVLELAPAGVVGDSCPFKVDYSQGDNWGDATKD